MRVTQVEIARRVGMDVSSINKILNGLSGAIFREETIKRVLEVAKELGWKPSPKSKFSALRQLKAAKDKISALEAENKSLKEQLATVQKLTRSA